MRAWCAARCKAGRISAGWILKPLAGAAEWLKFYERFWNERLDSLEALLRHPDKE